MANAGRKVDVRACIDEDDCAFHIHKSEPEASKLESCPWCGKKLIDGFVWQFKTMTADEVIRSLF